MPVLVTNTQKTRWDVTSCTTCLEVEPTTVLTTCFCETRLFLRRRNLRWIGHAAAMRETRNVHGFLFGKLRGKRTENMCDSELLLISSDVQKYLQFAFQFNFVHYLKIQKN